MSGFHCIICGIFDEYSKSLYCKAEPLVKDLLVDVIEDTQRHIFIENDDFNIVYSVLGIDNVTRG